MHNKRDRCSCTCGYTWIVVMAWQQNNIVRIDFVLTALRTKQRMKKTWYNLAGTRQPSRQKTDRLGRIFKEIPFRQHTSKKTPSTNCIISRSLRAIKSSARLGHVQELNCSVFPAKQKALSCKIWNQIWNKIWRKKKIGQQGIGGSVNGRHDIRDCFMGGGDRGSIAFCPSKTKADNPG